MATRTKRPVKKTTTKVEKKVEFSLDRRLSVSVGTCADYGKAKTNLMLSQNVPDGVDHLEVADELFGPLSDKMIEKFDELCEKLEVEEDLPDEEEYEDEPEEETDDSTDTDDDWEDEGEDEGDEEDEGEDEGEDDDITEEEVMAMSKKDLVALCKEFEELSDIDTKAKLSDLRNAIADELFGEEADEGEGEEGDDEWDDDDWDDED